MKKLLAVLISLSLVSNGSLYSMARFKESAKGRVSKVGRLWHCLTKPVTSGCSAEERKKARKWLIYTPTAVVVSLLVAAGIVASRTYLKKALDKASRENLEKDLNDAYATFSKEWKNLQPKLKGVTDKISSVNLINLIRTFSNFAQGIFDRITMIDKFIEERFTKIGQKPPQESQSTYTKIYHILINASSALDELRRMRKKLYPKET